MMMPATTKMTMSAWMTSQKGFTRGKSRWAV